GLEGLRAALQEAAAPAQVGVEDPGERRAVAAGYRPDKEPEVAVHPPQEAGGYPRPFLRGGFRGARRMRSFAGRLARLPRQHACRRVEVRFDGTEPCEEQVPRLLRHARPIGVLGDVRREATDEALQREGPAEGLVDGGAGSLARDRLVRATAAEAQVVAARIAVLGALLAVGAAGTGAAAGGVVARPRRRADRRRAVVGRGAAPGHAAVAGGARVAVVAGAAVCARRVRASARRRVAGARVVALIGRRAGDRRPVAGAGLASVAGRARVGIIAGDAVRPGWIR